MILITKILKTIIRTVNGYLTLMRDLLSYSTVYYCTVPSGYRSYILNLTEKKIKTKLTK